MSTHTPAVASAPLGELAAFLVDLGVATHARAAYPAGHPLLLRSAQAVQRRIDALLRDRTSLSFGVARRQLVVDGVVTDPHNPVLSGLAQRLHRQRIGAVSIARDCPPEEIAEFLGLLAADVVAPAQEPVRSLPHIQVYPLSYARLELRGEEEGAGADAPAADRPTELWLGLARAALEAGEADAAVPSEPEVVAEAINRHRPSEGYEQVIVGYLLQLSEETRRQGGRNTAEVRRRLSQLFGALSPEVTERLLQMGGDTIQRNRFLRDANLGFATDAVLRLVQAAAAVSGQNISNALLRLLAKLATHAETDESPLQRPADAAVREQVSELLAGWSLPDPNPGTYTLVLDRLAHEATGMPGRGPGAGEPEPERIVQTALEVDAVGPAVWGAVERLAAEGRLPALVGLLDDAPPGSRTAERLWDRLCSPEALVVLLRAGPDAHGALDRLIARMGTGAIPALLDEMAESPSRLVRRTALARLAGLGPAAVGEAVRRLDDPRWYVVRNLLVLVRGAPEPPAGFSPGPWLTHPDGRVRREALAVAFRLPGERERALGLALVDAEPTLVRGALAECQRGCPAALVPLVRRHAEDRAGDGEARLLAIQALGAARDPLALRTLVRLVDGGRSWRGRRRLLSASPEMLGALGALAAGWADHPEAAPLLRLAAESPDAPVRHAALLPLRAR